MSASDPQPAPSRTADALVEQAAQDRSAWIPDHLDAVFRYARRRLETSDAEDVTQQAFEALFRAHADGRTPRDAGAYLIGVARRRVADLLRTRARRPAVSLPVGWEGFGDHPLQSHVLEAAELRELVHVVLGTLPGPDREALLAYYRSGVSVAEIGRRLGTSPKGAEMRLRRARAAFKERFQSVGRDWTEDPVAGPSSPEEVSR